MRDIGEQNRDRFPPHAGEVRRRVLAELLRRGSRGATECELYGSLALNRDTVRQRRCELRDAGLVVDSGHKRPSHAGKPCIVWIVRNGVTLSDLQTPQPKKPRTIYRRKPPASPAPPARPTPREPTAPENHAALAIACRRCGSEEYRDFPIHNGQSLRRDCNRCGWTLGFPLWYGKQRSGQS